MAATATATPTKDSFQEQSAQLAERGYGFSVTKQEVAAEGATSDSEIPVQCSKKDSVAVNITPTLYDDSPCDGVVPYTEITLRFYDDKDRVIDFKDNLFSLPGHKGALDSDDGYDFEFGDEKTIDELVFTLPPANEGSTAVHRTEFKMKKCEKATYDMSIRCLQPGPAVFYGKGNSARKRKD